MRRASRRSYNETDDAVTIAEKLMKVSSFVEVVLAAPLDGRAVIDAATGRRLESLDIDPSVPPRRRYGPRGCPRWLQS